MHWFILWNIYGGIIQAFLSIFRLKEIIERRIGKNLYFSTDVNKEISSSDMIFLSVNTPTKTRGLGSGEASDLKYIESSARQVAKYATGETIVVEKSTIPVKTAETIEKILGNFEDYKHIIINAQKKLNEVHKLEHFCMHQYNFFSNLDGITHE